MTMTESREWLAEQLLAIGALKLDGPYTLKSGISSPFYIDLRQLISHPKVLTEVSRQCQELLRQETTEAVSLCGVPYTALPIASVMSCENNLPMVIRRKEGAKKYGTKKAIEGNVGPGVTIVIIEDIVTSGASVLETVEPLRATGSIVDLAIVVLDRQQGASARLAASGVKVVSLFRIIDLLELLVAKNIVQPAVLDQVREFVAANQVQDVAPVKEVTAPLRFEARAKLAKNGVAKRIFETCVRKQTNLCVSADLTTAAGVLECARKAGPFISVLKTHVDVISDFTPGFIKELTAIAEEFDFVIFEDRKFADIGNTVSLQYGSGVFAPASWAPLTNVHVVAGSGTVAGLHAVVKDYPEDKPRGCLVISEMSSGGNLLTPEYQKAALEIATSDTTGFVCGFICQHALFGGASEINPEFVYMSPGVKMETAGDGLGQNYRTPQDAIIRDGCDIVIVGRGIYGASDIAASARMYRDGSWSAYNKQFE